jgi:hypothetical protein
LTAYFHWHALSLQPEVRVESDSTHWTLDLEPEAAEVISSCHGSESRRSSRGRPGASQGCHSGDASDKSSKVEAARHQHRATPWPVIILIHSKSRTQLPTECPLAAGVALPLAVWQSGRSAGYGYYTPASKNKNTTYLEISATRTEFVCGEYGTQEVRKTQDLGVVYYGGSVQPTPTQGQPESRTQASRGAWRSASASVAGEGLPES